MKHGPKIAAHTTSGALQIRRAAWVSQKGNAPGFYGRTIIAPKYIQNEVARAEYQAKLRTWYRTLSDKARHFLGLEWEQMCDPPSYKPRRHNPPETPTQQPR
jgi:hypothetical protein